jgi:hypothetical protein
MASSRLPPIHDDSDRESAEIELPAEWCQNGFGPLGKEE